MLNEQAGDTIVYVPEINEAFVLPALTASVWRRADGRTTIPEMACQIADELRRSVDEETIWSALDCLAEARLLLDWNVPRTGARRDLMHRSSLRAGLCLATIQIVRTISAQTSPLPAAANGEQQDKEQQGKHRRKATNESKVTRREIKSSWSKMERDKPNGKPAR